MQVNTLGQQINAAMAAKQDKLKAEIIQLKAALYTELEQQLQAASEALTATLTANADALKRQLQGEVLKSRTAVSQLDPKSAATLAASHGASKAWAADLDSLAHQVSTIIMLVLLLSIGTRNLCVPSFAGMFGYDGS